MLLPPVMFGRRNVASAYISVVSVRASEANVRCFCFFVFSRGQSRVAFFEGTSIYVKCFRALLSLRVIEERVNHRVIV